MAITIAQWRKRRVVSAQNVAWMYGDYIAGAFDLTIDYKYTYSFYHSRKHGWMLLCTDASGWYRAQDEHTL